MTCDRYQVNMHFFINFKKCLLGIKQITHWFYFLLSMVKIWTNNSFEKNKYAALTASEKLKVSFLIIDCMLIILSSSLEFQCNTYYDY